MLKIFIYFLNIPNRDRLTVLDYHSGNICVCVTYEKFEIRHAFIFTNSYKNLLVVIDKVHAFCYVYFIYLMRSASLRDRCDITSQQTFKDS